MPSDKQLWEHYRVEHSDLWGYLLVSWLNRLHQEGWRLIAVQNKDYYFERTT